MRVRLEMRIAGVVGSSGLGINGLEALWDEWRRGRREVRLATRGIVDLNRDVAVADLLEMQVVLGACCVVLVPKLDNRILWLVGLNAHARQWTIRAKQVEHGSVREP